MNIEANKVSLISKSGYEKSSMGCMHPSRPHQLGDLRAGIGCSVRARVTGHALHRRKGGKGGGLSALTCVWYRLDRGKVVFDSSSFEQPPSSPFLPTTTTPFRCYTNRPCRCIPNALVLPSPYHLRSQSRHDVQHPDTYLHPYTRSDVDPAVRSDALQTCTNVDMLTSRQAD